MSTPLQKIIQSSSNPNLVEKAFNFAREAHQDQKRYSGEDYILHPLGVADILSGMKLDPKTVAAGFLHDVPDDTQRTLKDIEKEFGKEVAFLVEGVSKLGKLRYPKQNIPLGPIEKRISEPIDLRAENLRKMFFAMAEDLRVILIKLADRLDNMKTLNVLPLEKQKRIALETLEIFAPLANRLGIGEIKGQLEDLAFPYLYPKEFTWLMENVKEKYEEMEKRLKKVKPVLIKILEKEGIKPISTHSRAKYYFSLYQKLLRYDMNFEKMYDLVALRIIINNIEDCYKALGIIHKHWKPLPGLIKDYIAFPKPNNYQAIHTTCFCLDGKITEIQIKTEGMHKEDEYGIAAHWAYKEGIDLKSQRKKFAWVQQLRDWQKEVGTKEYLESLKIDFFKNRIFVLTPKGDVIDLPEGATPIDFAYAVHTDIGNRCAGAKINGKIISLSQSLKNGEVVEVIVDKKRRPSRDWLDFAKTSLARSQVKSQLKKESRPDNLNRGIKLLNESLRQIQGTTFTNISQTKKEELLQSFPYKNLESLMVAVGEGEISPQEILKSLLKEKDILTPPKSRPRLHLEKTPAEISLAGETGIQIYLAKCCLPQPGEAVKAYITKNRGASIHKNDCKNLTRAQKKWPQKIIEASWPKEGKLPYAVLLKIKADDRVGLVRDISSVISNLGINILTCEVESHPTKTLAIFNTEVEISGLEELDKLFGQLKQISGVIEIRKV